MNDFGSAFDENMFSDLLGNDGKQYEFRALAIVDKYTKELVAELQNSTAAVQIIYAEYTDKVQDVLTDIDIVLIECRLMEGFKDLKLISAIRQERPLIPIISISCNMDPEFMLAAYDAGVHDYVNSDIPSEVLAAKLRCFYKIADSSRHLEVKNQEALDSMKSMRKSKEKLKQEITSRLDAETQREFALELAEIHKKNKEILDNLREAFFVVRTDLQIDETTSASCKVLFGHDIGGKRVGESLNLKQNKESFIALGLEQLFEDFMPENVTLQMLPKQVQTETGIILDLVYTVIHDSQNKPEHVIVAASDVTETIRQKQLFTRQIHLYNTLFFLLQNSDSFAEFLSDFKADIAAMKESKQRETVLRILHTIKGNSGVYTLDFLAKRIHAIETMISKKRVSDQAFFAFVEQITNDLEKQMCDFLQRHIKILNMDYNDTRHDHYTITAAQLSELTKLATAEDSGSRKVLLNELDLLKFRPLSVLTSTLPNVVDRVASKLQKKINFVIHGDHWRTNTDILSPVFRSLVHLLNNACDHGIERPDQRAEQDKDSCGTLQLNMQPDENDGLCITIEDDGRGINAERIRKLALEKKLLSEANLNKLSEEEVHALIFLDGFSTSAEVSQTSGRGVGMAAVKAEVEQLGGTIIIKTTLGKGTSFQITIPDVIMLGKVGKAA